MQTELAEATCSSDKSVARFGLNRITKLGYQLWFSPLAFFSNV